MWNNPASQVTCCPSPMNCWILYNHETNKYDFQIKYILVKWEHNDQNFDQKPTALNVELINQICYKSNMEYS